MKRFAYRWLTCACLQGIAFLSLAGGEQASRKPFDHYEPILTRRPFGARAPAVEVDAPAPPPKPDFARQLKLVALRDGAGGVRVGLVDESTRPPKSHYLQLGIPGDGLTILDVDFEGGRALVRKDGQQDWISMRAGESTQPAPAVGAGAGIPAAAAAEAVRESSAAGLSYAERRRQRLETMRSRVREPEAPSTPAPDPAELEHQLQEYQMNLIRSGRTPLPIPLSDAADAQLVAEGLLPP